MLQETNPPSHHRQRVSTIGDGRSGESCSEWDNQGNFAQKMDVQEKVVKEMEAKNICWELPAGNRRAEMWSPTQGSEESPGSGHFRRSWVPADEKILENPRHGASSSGSSGGSRRSFKMLPPLPYS